MVKYDYNIRDDLKINFTQKKIILITIFAVAGVLSDLLATKVCSWGFFSIECGCILFPVCYLVADVITEVFGEKTMIKTAFLGMSMKVMMVICGLLCIAMPFDPATFTAQPHLAYVFGFVPRITFASLCGYIVGQFVNARLMTVIGNYTNGEHLFLRTIGSTIGGEFVDTILFIGIAFVGTMPPIMLLGFILTQYVMKVLIETFLQPVTYKAVSWCRKDHTSIDYRREDL